MKPIIYCIDCGKKLGKHAHLYGNKRCHSCNGKQRIGKKFSEETKKRISVRLMGNKNSLGKNKGRTVSEETRRKMSLSLKGKPSWNKGIPHTEKHKKSLSINHADINGVRHWNWRGGITLEQYSENWDDILRENIRKRDDYLCQLCSKKQTNIRFDVHHIDYNKKNCEEDNLITLCRSCHMKTNIDRNYWINLFINRKINVKNEM